MRVPAALARQARAAVACDDRPIVGVVGMDPAYRGASGLCLWGLGDFNPSCVLEGDAFDSGMTGLLSNAVAELCAPGERVVLAIESTTFGAGIARKLGRAAGAVESMLVDTNAISRNSVLDVAVSSWRNGMGIRVKGRANLKSEAVRVAQPFVAPGVALSHDAAEAVLIAAYAKRVLVGTMQ